MKRAIWIVLLVVSLASGGWWFYKKAVDSFCDRSIHLHSWPKGYDTIFCKYSAEQVRKIIDQPYTYLGKGRQFFVFASADGKYVLKFIKCQRINVSEFIKQVPLPGFLDDMRNRRLQERQEKIEGIFSSVALAAGTLAKNTGVLFAHLAQKEDVQKSVVLIDKLGMQHLVKLDDVPFVVQERAVAVLPTFSKLLEARDYRKVHRRFDQLFALIISDAKAGVVDSDSGTIVRDNVAFLSNRAIHVDIGTLYRDENAFTKTNLEKQFSHLDPLIEWMETKDPKLASELRQKMTRYLEAFASST